MPKWKARKPKTLEQRYPASEPCDCGVCRGNCQIPGLWTVAQAKRAIEAGLGDQMTLRLPYAGSPLKPCLAPAMVGTEGAAAIVRYRGVGCTFWRDGHCAIHNTPHKPLECRFVHHDRTGQGQQCHDDIMADWATDEGQIVVNQWAKDRGILSEKGLELLNDLIAKSEKPK